MEKGQPIIEFEYEGSITKIFYADIQEGVSHEYYIEGKIGFFMDLDSAILSFTMDKPEMHRLLLKTDYLWREKACAA